MSELNQKAAIGVLNNQRIFQENLNNIIIEKELLKNALQKLDLVKKIYPSDANFLLIEVENADKIYSTLLKQQIITRNRNKQVINCIRISVGTSEGNQRLITALKNIQ